ncbi:1-(5-phosphoribosyl)-5-[(5-phosphoribosylamino) me thylideneamino]imidazole-4-carboxamide isomerase [Brevundimonas terrae]|uniref:1-(5-phosphoribosyl)-5-[(5-phosphoribosylamino)methylideneamino] imidazole-4-carboxamide isomerase n=1 Tax=Brevundimonas terrae TaxID=363631 RepID=A0ABN0Y699_9CAUL|nr:1-(5-phosphoribosyl)-5-[(5-phosphoribosylamino)methylideneamino]imidazole-4-carboxamide isomerase [Brevundimonas terrae]NIJ25561.1 phosphoribosylformimino-5-aminoimidazole carboxamide ribotide isomerase [Brevundimonas terrae]
MIIYPAIDLKDGFAVRLLHGDFNQVTRYDDNPAHRLAAFAAEGAQWVHIVDLDGAKAGAAQQYELVGEMARAVDIKIQCGGGVRTEDDIKHLLDNGVTRVVVGSLAVTQTDQVLAWLDQFGSEAITLALDVKYEDGLPVPALKGWTQSAGVDLWTVLDRYPSSLLTHVLMTDVSRDGALTGANIDLLSEAVQRRPDLKIQASGGVATLEDLTAAKAIGCDGAITGRALYEGRFTVTEALKAVQ